MKSEKENNSSKFKPEHRKIMKKPGTAPGTLVFTGQKKVDAIKIRRTIISGDSILSDIIDLAEMNQLSASAGMIWLDIIGIHDPEIIERIGKYYGINPLILEDVLNVNQNPKYVELESGNFLSMQSFYYDPDLKKIDKQQISIYFNEKVLITFREDDPPEFQPIYDRLNNGKNRFYNRHPDYLTYAVLDLIVDKFLEASQYLDDKIEELEVKIEKHPDNHLKQEIFYFRRSFLVFLKVIPGIREAVLKMKTSGNEAIHAETKAYLADLLDHTNQLYNMADTYNEMIYGLYDLYHAEINYRTNNIIKTLTILSTIFIPLTFIVGVYGMNFRVMPELEWQFGYPMVWLVMIFFTIVTLIYFRSKKWI